LTTVDLALLVIEGCRGADRRSLAIGEAAGWPRGIRDWFDVV